MKYLFYKYRDTDLWCLGSWPRRLKSNGKTGRKHCNYYETTEWLIKSEYPENVSIFVEQHEIIEAESEKEAWQTLSLKFPMHKFRTQLL